MTALKTIDRLAAKKLHEELNEAIRASTHLRALAEKYGLRIRPTNASFDAGKFVLKVEAALADAPVNASLLQMAAMVGFDGSGPVTVNGVIYRLAGYTRGRLPWRIENLDGSGRYLKCADAWMLKNFPAAPRGEDAHIGLPTGLRAHG